MRNAFREQIEDCPIIAAVKDKEGLEKCLSSDIQVVFILYGDVISITEIVEQVKEYKKTAIVHIDLINGLSTKEISVDYLKNNTKADGIISTKPALIKRAKELELFTVMRFFVIDSMAYDNIHNQCSSARPDCIEVLPGVMPKVIAKIHKAERIPIIAGGLISDKEDIMAALDAGAVSISSTNTTVWFL